MDNPNRRRSNSFSDGSDSGRSTPRHIQGPESALILVHDDSAASSPRAFEFEEGEDEDDDEGGPDSPSFGSTTRPGVGVLSPSLVLLYLLAPYLRLGATMIPHKLLPLQLSLPIIIGLGLLAALSRQVWYLLARYFRKADAEEIMLEAFARGRGKERRRSAIRVVARGATGIVRVLVASLYLRQSSALIFPILPTIFEGISQPLVTIVLSFLLLPVILGRSLASKRVAASTSFSLAAFVVWFGLVAYAHGQGTLNRDIQLTRLGEFWRGITLLTFAFTSSNPLSLYASLKAHANSRPVATSKRPRSQSFRVLSLLSVVVALAFMIPLVIFSAKSNDRHHQTDTSDTTIELNRIISVANALILLFSIPSILVTSPHLPLPSRLLRSSRIPISKLVYFVAFTALGVVKGKAASILNDIVWGAAFTKTFFLPAIVHAAAHFIRRPLSIVVPSTPLPSSSFPSTSHNDNLDDDYDAPNSASDPLLQKKEKSLQKKQLWKRIGWDVAVVGLLVPVSVAGFVWMGKVGERM